MILTGYLLLLLIVSIVLTGKQEQWSNDAFETVYEANYNETMTIYDVLCYSKDGCHLANEFEVP